MWLQSRCTGLTEIFSTVRTIFAARKRVEAAFHSTEVIFKSKFAVQLVRYNSFGIWNGSRSFICSIRLLGTFVLRLFQLDPFLKFQRNPLVHKTPSLLIPATTRSGSLHVRAGPIEMAIFSQRDKQIKTITRFWMLAFHQIEAWTKDITAQSNNLIIVPGPSIKTVFKVVCSLSFADCQIVSFCKTPQMSLFCILSALSASLAFLRPTLFLKWFSACLGSNSHCSVLQQLLDILLEIQHSMFCFSLSYSCSNFLEVLLSL